MSIQCNAKRIGLVALLSSFVISATALSAQNSLPQKWPTFSEPSSIINVGLAGQSGDDFMANVSFQGAYNQQQLSSRLYVNTPSDANYWLSHAVASGVTVSDLSYNSGDPDGTLKALLSTYGPQGSNTVSKYVICDPVGAPETCNMATTMAGINDAIVINPDNLSLMSTYGMTEVTNGDLRSYFWIGSTSDLIGNGSTYGTTNMISNPSGGNGTTGWSDNSGTLTTSTGSGSCGGQGTTLEWTRTSGSGDAWAWYDPAIPSARINTTPYIFSVQVCVASGSAVFLDAWDGSEDLKSGSVSAGSGWQTLQLSVPIPLVGASGNTTIKLQVRTSGSSTQVFFHNAAVVDNRVAVDYYQYKNLFSSANQTILAQDFPGSSNLRDYLIAGKIFTFELTDDGAYTDEQKLYGLILGKTPHVTPVMGYIDHEIEDVSFMSGSSYGKFLNASDNYNNGSVWASMPQPSSLSQPTASPMKVFNGSVYLALASTDGDNSSVVEHQNQGHWTNNLFLGAVPMAWTIVPSMTQFAPGIISNYFAYLPQSSEMMSGPSGFGYVRDFNTTDMSTFASDTNQFMTAEDMNSVTYWTTSNTSSDESNLFTFAADVDVPHVVWGTCIGGSSPTCAEYNEKGSKPTVVDDQAVGYEPTAPTEVSALVNCLKSSTCVNYNSGAPNFIEAMVDDFTLTPDDVLYIAQSLQNQETYPIVYMTPSELAASEYAYKHSGSTVTSSPQAVLGSTLNTAFPQNVLWNAQGQSGNYGTSSSSWALGSNCTTEHMVSTVYQGGGTLELYVPGNAGACYAWEYLGNVPVAGRYYRFTANVAGSGTAQMTIYDGSANNHSNTVTLTSSYQTITMIVKMNSTSSGQIQIGVTSSTGAQTLYFGGGTAQPVGWYYNPPSSSGTLVSAGGANYNNGSFSTQAMSFTVPSGQSSSQWIAAHPGDAPSLKASTSYTATVDVAGTAGQSAYLDLWNNSTDTTSATVTLGQQWQTLTATYTSGSTPSNDQFEIRVPSGNSAQETVYFRNAALVPTSSIPTYLFKTGLESGETQLTWTNTVDNTSPGGGESDVSGALTEASSTITRGGGSAIQYGGTASGGSSTHAYLEAFSNGSTLSSTSRLSYWVYPMTPLGSESGASSMTGLNSTCVAIDIIFTDGTTLRGSTVTDQYGNQLSPANECNHLEPDQWNYVTANLGSLSGKTVSRLDVGYDQPGASGNYGGFIDDIGLTH